MMYLVAGVGLGLAAIFGLIIRSAHTTHHSVARAMIDSNLCWQQGMAELLEKQMKRIAQAEDRMLALADPAKYATVKHYEDGQSEKPRRPVGTKSF